MIVAYRNIIPGAIGDVWIEHIFGHIEFVNKLHLHGSGSQREALVQNLELIGR